MFSFPFSNRRSFQTARSMPTLRLIALISFFGQLYFFVPVMTPYLLERDLTIAEIAGLQTTLMVAMLVMEVPTGVLADRIGHVRSYRIAVRSDSGSRRVARSCRAARVAGRET